MTTVNGVAHITFDKPFSKAPNVVVCPVGSSLTQISAAKVKDVSTTGFDIVASTMTSGNATIQPLDVTLQWIAVGN